MKPKELDYPEGSILHDVRYRRSPDRFEVVYWDPLTERLEVKYEEAIIGIYFVKEEYRTFDYQISQISKDKCYEIFCKPSQIPKCIALNFPETKWEKLYKDNKDVVPFKQLKRMMCECPWVFKADFEPEVYFRLRWISKYGTETDATKVTNAFLDIETDVLDRTVDMDDIYHAPQPINALTLIFPHEKICVLFALGPRPKSKLDPKFHHMLLKQEADWNWLKTHMDEFKRMIVDLDEDNKKYLEGFDIRVHLFEFNDEINLIKSTFDYINKYRPFFVLSWNAIFDHNYLINRITELGYDPFDMVIPKEFEAKELYYHLDDRDEKTTETAKDFMHSSTYSVYMCQMKRYAGIRKSQSKKPSYSLDYTGGDVCGIHKKTEKRRTTFRQWAYDDLIEFLLYNVRDVVVQYAIEDVTNDSQSLLSRSYEFATSYSKCFEETHIVRNERELFYEEFGEVQANRLVIPEGIDTAFQGAFVADPEKNMPTGYVYRGKPINCVIYGSGDADAAAYYPSSKMGCNKDPMSLDYKIIIDNICFMRIEDANYYCQTLGKEINYQIIHSSYNMSLNQEYIWWDSKSPPRPHAVDIAGPLMNCYKSGNEMSLMTNWFNAPDITELFKILDAQIV